MARVDRNCPGGCTLRRMGGRDEEIGMKCITDNWEKGNMIKPPYRLLLAFLLGYVLTYSISSLWCLWSVCLSVCEINAALLLESRPRNWIKECAIECRYCFWKSLSVEFKHLQRCIGCNSMRSLLYYYYHSSNVPFNLHKSTDSKKDWIALIVSSLQRSRSLFIANFTYNVWVIWSGNLLLSLHML